VGIHWEDFSKMKKIALWGACALVAAGIAGAAIAADDPMAGAYGNTVIVTNAKGESYKLWIKNDGSYSVETAKGEKGTGKWSLKDNNSKYCSIADKPANAPADMPAPTETCSEFKGAHKAGDKWDQMDSNNEKITVEIKAGA
jgi:hypothetical protein